MSEISISPKYQPLWTSDSRYLRWYIELCETRSTYNRVKGDGVYYESHHIIPKWLGGSNDNKNLVLFTAREHYLAHYFLFLHLRDKSSSAAFHLMNESVNNDYRDSKKYAELREFQSEQLKGDKNPSKRKDVRAKISKKVSGEGNGMYGRTGKSNPFYGKKHSQAFLDYKRRLHGKKITYKGVTYDSINQAEKETGLSAYKLKKAIANE